MNFKMNNLTKEDGRIYIKARLQSAGSTLTVFDDSALETILNASNGICRVINKICDMSLAIADSKQLDIINADIALEAVNEIELG
jgi:type II secretory pathway predicted ATPase ExeA